MLDTSLIAWVAPDDPQNFGSAWNPEKPSPSIRCLVRIAEDDCFAPMAFRSDFHPDRVVLNVRRSHYKEDQDALIKAICDEWQWKNLGGLL